MDLCNFLTPVWNDSTLNVPVLYKNKVVGDAAVVDTNIKRVVLIDRYTFEVLSTKNVKADNSWELYSPLRLDETLCIIAFDDAGNFNADVFDWCSLETESLSIDTDTFDENTDRQIMLDNFLFNVPVTANGISEYFDLTHEDILKSKFENNIISLVLPFSGTTSTILNSKDITFKRFANSTLDSIEFTYTYEFDGVLVSQDEFIVLGIDSTGLTEDVSNVMVPIKLQNFPEIMNNLVYADRGNLRCTLMDLTYLDIVITDWDDVLKQGLIWIKFPLIKWDEVTKFLLIFNENVDISKVVDEYTSDASALWGSFNAVYHFNTTPVGVDALENAIITGSNGTPSGMTGGNLIDGDFGKSWTFDGVDDFITISSGLFETVQTEGTIDIVFKTSEVKGTLISQDAVGWNDLDTVIGVGQNGVIAFTDGNFGFETHGPNMSESRGIESDVVVNDDTMQVLTMKWDGVNYTLCHNGTFKSVSTAFGAFGADTDMLIGKSIITGVPFQGQISEIRMSDVAKSDSEILLFQNSVIGTAVKTQTTLGLPILGTFGMISFDTLTYKVFINSAWKSVVSKDPAVHGVGGDTTWYYFDGTDWVKNIGNVLAECISDFHENDIGESMLLSEISSITLSDYSSEFVPNTGNLDIGISLISEVSTTDIQISNVIINNEKVYLSQLISLDDYSLVIQSITAGFSYVETSGFDFAQVKLHSIVTGSTWKLLATNPQEIEDISSGMDTTGVNLQFKIVVPLDFPEESLINVYAQII